jgi:hypothetical protein
MDSTENASNNSSTVARVFVAAVTFLLSRCLATRRDIRWGFIKYAVEMDPGTMIYVQTKFHEDWFSHSNADKVGYTDSIAIA